MRECVPLSTRRWPLKRDSSTLSDSRRDPFDFLIPPVLESAVPSDAELFEAWSGGDRRAGGALFQRHFEAVRRFFANKVHDPLEIEELIQRTFTACVEGRDRFEGRASFRSYLLGIARFQCFKHWEARAKLDRHDPVDDHPIAEMSDRPSSVLARSANERMLLEALRHIPLREQTVVELHYWQDLSGREIGEVLGLPENTIRSTLRRAKHKLHKQLCRMQQVLGVPETTEDDLGAWARALRGRLDADIPAGESRPPGPSLPQEK